MVQFRLRADDKLAAAIRHEAAASGLSMNAWVLRVLGAAVDPDLAGSDAARTRERLARAGLVADVVSGPHTAPDPERLARARAAASRGTPLSELVSTGRD